MARIGAKVDNGSTLPISPEQIKKLTEAIRAGNYFNAACRWAGISASAFDSYLAKGREEDFGPYKDFLTAVEQAEADAEVMLVVEWRRNVTNNWRAARDLLARRYPERWGSKQNIQVGSSDGSVEIAFKWGDEKPVVEEETAEDSEDDRDLSEEFDEDDLDNN